MLSKSAIPITLANGTRRDEQAHGQSHEKKRFLLLKATTSKQTVIAEALTAGAFGIKQGFKCTKVDKTRYSCQRIAGLHLARFN